ncbi:hypothetical protein ALO68_101332 [Pseudomonas syringae pv. helianthi]|uniref:Uncharacterized protein n=1 Tax=Pseudomonas syringae pv. helianthi TaxID=251654 RepID=A0A0N8RPP6_9PSED|nr:hypothetical protein ALO68_101332 [Pseudomonas syringae pv. helianthi]RMR03510.1 hypothetical protein ALP93_100962 [Pseudomonas syringae pv. helianthi]RMV46198.1 hypothetical protein ALP10_101094 [Pseudomonas syringae pv. helianthi]
MLPVSRLKKLSMLTERAPKAKGGVKKLIVSGSDRSDFQFHDTNFTVSGQKRSYKCLLTISAPVQVASCTADTPVMRR